MQYLWGTPVESTKGTPNPHTHTTRAWHTIGADLFTLDRTLCPYSLTTTTGRTERPYERPIRTKKLWNPTGMSGCCPKDPLVCIHPPQTIWGMNLRHRQKPTQPTIAGLLNPHRGLIFKSWVKPRCDLKEHFRMVTIDNLCLIAEIDLEHVTLRTLN